MATRNTYRIGTNAIPQIKQDAQKLLYTLKKEINFATQTMDAGNGDVETVLDIPANTLVLGSWINVLTACTTNGTVDLGYGSDVNYWGNGLPLDATGLVSTRLTASETKDWGSLNTATEATEDMTVATASLGDTCSVGIGTDVTDVAMVGFVTAADTVTAQLFNLTGGAINLASTTIEAFVDKAPRSGAPLLFTSADTIDIVATTDTADADISSGIIEVIALCLDFRLT
jgi:hypothetical protein